MALQEAAANVRSSTGPARWRAPAGARIASLAPFLLAVALQVVGARFSGPLFPPPDVLGIPLGVVIGAIVLAWAAFGSLVVWTTGSRLAVALALAFVTLPSMFALLFAPAMLLIIQNLGSI